MEGVEGTPDGGQVLKVRVRAAPEGGKANAALIETVSEWLGVPKTSISLKAGATSRIKTLSVAGESGELQRIYAERIASLAGSKETSKPGRDGKSGKARKRRKAKNG